MGTRRIPENYIHTCDGCKATEQTESVRRPKYWSDLIINRDAYDYQGCAVADGSVQRLLCGDCSKKIENAINSALK